MTAYLGELVTIALMAIALGMDAFSVSLGMGMYRLPLRQIVRIGLTIGFFHVFMPLFGMLAGHFLSEKFGNVAAYIGGCLITLLGIQMIFTSANKQKETVIAPIGFGLLVFAFSVSLDSFSAGLTLGIYGAQIFLVLFCFGTAATILSWLGLLVGKRMQTWLGTYSLTLGGGILLAFGLKLILSY